MTLTENFIHNAILIDPEAEIVYSSDQINDTYPYRFPTVEFMLTATKTLVEMADHIRLEKGYLPMYPIDGRNDEVDNDGWYDFYIGISKFLGNDQQGCDIGISKFLGNDQQGCVDNCINFIVRNSDSDDNEDMYAIELTDDERSAMYEILNAQCRKNLNKTCDDLLAESEADMENEVDAI